jgi:hypothetical protein
MQSIFDWFSFFRTFVMDCITFVSMRFYGHNCTFEEVQNRAYRNIQNTRRHFNLDNAKDLDTVLALAKDLLKDATDSRSYVTDKVKTLLTLNSALLAILAAFLPKAIEFNWQWMRLLFYGGVLLLLNALIIMWMYFDIKSGIMLALE